MYSLKILAVAELYSEIIVFQQYFMFYFDFLTKYHIDCCQ